MDTQTQLQTEFWHTEDNPDVLLHTVWPGLLWRIRNPQVEGELSASLRRRLRLFGCACARMVWDMLSVDAQNAVLLSERFANGSATHASLRAAAIRMMHGPATYQQQATNAAGWASYGDLVHPANQDPLLWNPVEAARYAAKALATRAAGPAPPPGRPITATWQAAWDTTFAQARAHQAELVRDIFPPPSEAIRSLRLERDWLTSTVLTLAQQADETGEYSALPILADALQDAGCDNEIMLARCRAALQIHCRGNWVVDLLLGRE